MKKIIYAILWTNLLLAHHSFAVLLPGEGITLNPITGDYLFSYRDGATVTDPLKQLIFIPSTKVDPVLASTISLTGNLNVLYKYTLTNGSAAKQLIDNLRFFGLPVNAAIGGSTTISEGSRQMDIFESALTIPNANWYGSGTRIPGKEVNISWYYDDQKPIPKGIKSGTTLSGFGLSSLDLPGLFAAQVSGNGTGNLSFPNEGLEGEILDLYFQLQDNDFVPRNAAAPMIAVPVPYNAAVTLERIQAHAHTWIAKQLLDSVFSGQLDRLFQSAISAYRLNQPLVGKQHLDSLRTLIKQQQPNADKQVATITPIAMPPAKIDLLAARILYFNLGYVKRR